MRLPTARLFDEIQGRPRLRSIRSGIDMLVDSPVTAFARGTFGGVLLGAAAVAVLMAVLVWASRPGETERRLAAAASVIGAAFAVVLNLIFALLGVWQSTFFKLPPTVLASMFVLATALILLVLSCFR